MKTPYTLSKFALGVVALDTLARGYEPAAVAHMTAPARLLVDCDYTPPPKLYRHNGEPGDEPDPQECLDIMRIESAGQLHFADPDRGVIVTLMAGFGRNLVPYFTDSGLIVMELDLVKGRRAEAGEARIDRYQAGR